MREVKYEIDLQPMLDALGKMADELRKVRIPLGLFQYLRPTRRCELCAKLYEPQRPPSGVLDINDPSRCPDCMQTIDRVAVEARAVFGQTIKPDLIESLAMRRIEHRPFQYARPWQDHVPAHSKHLVKEK